MRIEGRTFLVSGGGSGLGRAACLRLAQSGAYVAILDIDAVAGGRVLTEMGSHKGRFFWVDISDTTSITTAISGVLAWAESTGGRVGGVVAAAGVGSPAKIISNTGEPASLRDFDATIAINLRGSIDLCRQILPTLISSEPAAADDEERGVLVLVASIAAFDGQPGQVAYSASKGAIVSLTLPLARELSRYGIRVVTIAPGVFDTKMIKVLDPKAIATLKRVMEFPSRAGKPSEFARMVTEVLENSMLNGTCIRLDGGLRMPSKI